MAKDVVNVLVEFSVKPYDIGEVFVIDACATNRIELTLGLVKHWSVIRNDLVSESAAQKKALRLLQFGGILNAMIFCITDFD